MSAVFLLAGTVLAGGVIAVLAGSRGTAAARLLFFFLSCLVTAGAASAALLLFARVSHLPFSREALFPDAASLLIGVFLYLLLSLAVGVLLGAVRERSLRAVFAGARHNAARRAVFRGFPVLALVFVGTVLALTCSQYRRDLRITEVCPRNFNLCARPDGQCADYIELYNAGDETIDLKGYALSDSGARLRRCALPSLEVPPGGYVIAWADGSKKAAALSDREVALNFRLSAGETLSLISPLGAVLSQVTLPELPQNVAYTFLDGGWAETSGTPWADNGSAVPYREAALAPPLFSAKGGFFDSGFSLELSAAEGDIYFTLDGSVPDETCARYERPIPLEDICAQPDRVVDHKKVVAAYDDYQPDPAPVKKGTVVRAVAIGDGEKSPVATQTYFIGDFSEFEGRSVLSIVADPEDLFGDAGIYTTGPAYDEWYAGDREGDAPAPNYNRRGAVWEKAANIQFWTGDGVLAVGQDCGIRVQGNASRGYAKKRFSLRARELYSGSDVFESPIFGKAYTHSFSIRNDSYDMFSQQLLTGREHLTTLGGVDAVIFLNGEFYFAGLLRERYDARWYAEHLGVEEDDLVLISDSEADAATDRELRQYKEFIDYLNTCDASDPAVYRNICRRMDVQSYIEFYCANNYLVNIDMSLYKNFKLWRTRSSGGEGVHDGRWRWSLYDMDAVAWAGDKLGQPAASVDVFHQTQPYTGHGDGVEYVNAPIFRTLIQNEEFKKQFVLTYLDMVNVDFDPARAAPILERLGLTDVPFYENFLRDRPAYARQYLAEAMELSGELCRVGVSLSEDEGGAVFVNTVQADCSAGEWTGLYFTDYPVTLRAEAAPGWRFAGWQDGDGNDMGGAEELICQLSGPAASYRAVFAKEGQP